MSFSFPGPKKLGDVVKLQLLQREDARRVVEIWEAAHNDAVETEGGEEEGPGRQQSTLQGSQKLYTPPPLLGGRARKSPVEGRKHAVARALPAAQGGLLRQRAKECGHAVYPVFKPGGFEMLYSQFQDRHFLLTSLEEYKRRGSAVAEPFLTVTLFDELEAARQQLTLIRGDFNPSLLSKTEATALLTLLLRSYLEVDIYEYIKTFCQEPQSFDFDRYLSAVRP